MVIFLWIRRAAARLLGAPTKIDVEIHDLYEQQQAPLFPHGTGEPRIRRERHPMTNAEHDPPPDSETTKIAKAGRTSKVAVSEATPKEELTDEQLLEEQEGIREGTDLPADDRVDEETTEDTTEVTDL